MDSILGLLRIKVQRGINLAVRDLGSSDPYVILTMGDQTFKTRVVNSNCNPEWEEQLTLSIKDINEPIKLEVYDKDMFSVDDPMGDVNIDIKPYIKCLRMGARNLPDGCSLSTIHPTRENCLADESSILYSNGKITQVMFLRLRNVESGEVEIHLEWVDVPGCRGLGVENTY